MVILAAATSSADVQGLSDRLRDGTSRPLGEVLGQCVCSKAFAHRVDDQRGVSMLSSAHFPVDPFVLHMGMCLLEEASCCVLVDVTRGFEFYGTPTGGGVKGSPIPKSSGFVHDGRGYFGGREMARLPSSSQIRGDLRGLRRRKDWHLLPRVLRRRRDRPSSSQCRGLLRRRRNRAFSSQLGCVPRRRIDRPSSSQRQCVPHAHGRGGDNRHDEPNVTRPQTEVCGNCRGRSGSLSEIMQIVTSAVRQF